MLILFDALLILCRRVVGHRWRLHVVELRELLLLLLRRCYIVILNKRKKRKKKKMNYETYFKQNKIKGLA